MPTSKMINCYLIGSTHEIKPREVGRAEQEPNGRLYLVSILLVRCTPELSKGIHKAPDGGPGAGEDYDVGGFWGRQLMLQTG